MKRMAHTPEEPWPSAELQQARACIAELEQTLAALKAAGNALLEQIEQGSDYWEIFEPEAETLRALCGGLKPAESPR
jgi:hypothetical protein